MGILDNENNILIDAVLTDVGREFLARNDGSFEIVSYAFGDDEIDYSLFNPNTGSLNQDLNIINTPVFEANVNEKISLKYRLISIANPDLKYIPSLSPSVTSLSLLEQTDASVGKTLEFSQKMKSGLNVPSEIRDLSFIVTLNNDLLFVEDQTPSNISPFGTAQLVLPATARTVSNGGKISFDVAVQSLTNELWDTMGSGTAGSRTISTKVKCIGSLSGLTAESTITITEEVSRS